LEQLTPEDPRLSNLEAIYIGGSRLPPEMFHCAITLLGRRIGVLYGMTEAPISCYLSPAMSSLSGEAILSVGKAVSGCAIRILGPDGPTQAAEVEGEVLIQGDHVMRGYWGNPAASESALEGGWLHTGDLGAFDRQGRLRIVGRLKEVIRTGATSVVPAEVEDVLMTHPAVAEAAVVGLPDPEWG
jgi:acyl-CoA synthetase (AMP-forming)/AMP-acid ligase II